MSGALKSVTNAFKEVGSRILTGGTMGGDDVSRAVEPRTGASEARRETARVRQQEQQAQAQAQQEEARQRRRRESMMRASLQPRESLLDILGTSQQTDRLG